MVVPNVVPFLCMSTYVFIYMCVSVLKYVVCVLFVHYSFLYMCKYTCIFKYVYMCILDMYFFVYIYVGGLRAAMGWLWLVGSIKLWVSFAKEPYKRDDILQKRHIILSILLIVATP